MAAQASEHTDLVILERHIDALKQRMSGLQERMATMASQQYETRNQSVLLGTMQEVLRDMHLLRLEMLAPAAGANPVPGPDRRPDGHRNPIAAAGRRAMRPAVSA